MMVCVYRLLCMGILSLMFGARSRDVARVALIMWSVRAFRSFLFYDNNKHTKKCCSISSVFIVIKVVLK